MTRYRSLLIADAGSVYEFIYVEPPLRLGNPAGAPAPRPLGAVAGVRVERGAPAGARGEGS